MDAAIQRSRERSHLPKLIGAQEGPPDPEALLHIARVEVGGDERSAEVLCKLWKSSSSRWIHSSAVFFSRSSSSVRR